MRKPGLRGDFWPTRRQELLLRAALAAGPEALRAWSEVRPTLDLDTLEDQSVRLMPLIHRRLGEEGVEDPLLPRLAGLRKRTWFWNQIHLDRLRSVVRAFQAEGIEAMALKGAVLALRYYPDPGLRPMGDVDVLVRPQRAPEAIDLLRDLGWRPEEDVPPDRLTRRQHGINFLGSRGESIDLHWHLLMELVLPGDVAGSSDEFWAGAEEVDLGGIRAAALSPSDQFLHMVMHGARARSAATVQWVADAWLVLAGKEIDWDRVLAHAERRRVFLQLRDALVYLRRLLDAPVPREVVVRLDAIVPTRRDRFVAWAAGRTTRLTGNLLQGIARHARLTSGAGLGPTVLGVPRFLTDWWNLDHAGQIPGYAVRRTLERRRERAAPVRGRRGGLDRGTGEGGP